MPDRLIAWLWRLFSDTDQAEEHDQVQLAADESVGDDSA